jgi:transposase-like protein
MGVSTAIFHSQKKIRSTARQPWPADQKAELVLEGLTGHREIAELCREAGISTACYYQWRRQFVDGGRSGLTRNEAKQHRLEERVQQLEAENASLQTRMHIFEDVCLAD